MKAIFKRLFSDVSGATALEYGLILGLMFIAMVMFRPEGLAGILHSIRKAPQKPQVSVVGATRQPIVAE